MKAPFYQKLVGVLAIWLEMLARQTVTRSKADHFREYRHNAVKSKVYYAAIHEITPANDVTS